MLPILDAIIKSKENTEIFFGSSSQQISSTESVQSPTFDELGDWEVLASTTYAEWKMIQNEVACFICLIRYFTNSFQLNEEQLLNSEGIAMICSMLNMCNATLLDVNVLMSVHLLVESVQNQMPSPNMELLECWYTGLIFNFRIWSRAHFQITIGHIQYISTMIKDDRKYFRYLRKA